MQDFARRMIGNQGTKNPINPLLTSLIEMLPIATKASTIGMIIGVIDKYINSVEKMSDLKMPDFKSTLKNNI